MMSLESASVEVEDYKFEHEKKSEVRIWKEVGSPDLCSPLLNSA